MHDSISTHTQKTPANDQMLRRVNDCFDLIKHFNPPKMLFDEFWREGELSLFFGAAGTGKSVLAMQVAEAIAHGRAIEGFRMEAKRPKVLYVDLVLSDSQFLTRYSAVSPQTSKVKRCEFSRNLYRGRPASNDKLCEWLREKIREHGFRVVVIDDLNAFRQTYDGTRETLALMRELRRIKDELEVSMLVLAGSREPGRSGIVSEADMMRSRILCDQADSVFAIGRLPRNAAKLYLVQTRSRNAAIAWNSFNAPVCWLTRDNNGNLFLKFDKRFDPKIDEELRLLICNVKLRHDVGATFREIAEDFGISKDKAARLYKKWTPEMDPPENQIADPDDDDEYEYEEEEELEDESDETGYGGIGPLPSQDEISDTDGHPDAYNPSNGKTAVEFDPLGHLKRSRDKNDREIFVEREDENGKPIVWYYRDTTGQLSRYENKGFGPSGRHVDGPICLFNTS